MLNEADHTYTGIITGVKRRSVTTILAEENYISKQFYREGFADLGTNVHRLTHAMDKGLKFKAPDIYMRYAAPYKAFFVQTGIRVVDSEVEIENPMLDYAGQLDKLCVDRNGDYGILDLKVSSCGYLSWHEFQSELYRQGLLWHPKYKSLNIKWKAGMILKPDCEIPTLIPHNRIAGIEKICSALAIVNADKHRHKIRMEEINSENGWII